MKLKLTNRASRAVAFTVLAALFALVAAKRFHTWQPQGFWGDDFANFQGFSLGGWVDVLRSSFLETYANRYRPFFGLAWGAWRALFGMNFEAYAVALYVLQGISAAIVFSMAYRLSAGKLVLSAAVSIVFASSRFALYQVTALTGMIEALALLFFLLMLWCVIASYQEQSREQSDVLRWAAVAAFVATVFTHERYLAAAPFLSAALWMLTKPSVARFALTVAPWLIFALNVLVKTLAMKTDFMQGTGGHVYSFDLARTLVQTREAFWSLFGVNLGQDYLVGIQSIGWIKRVGQLFTAGFSVVVISALLRATMRQRVFVLGIGLLAVMLLGPPILTIRLEQRWLFAPMTLMLLALAWATGVSNTRWVTAAAISCCAALFTVDMVISRSFGNTFIGYSAAMARFSTQVISDGSAGPPGTPLLIHTNPDGCTALFGGKVFELLEKQPRKLTCIFEDKKARELAAQDLSMPFFVPVEDAARLTFRREIVR